MEDWPLAQLRKDDCTSHAATDPNTGQPLQVPAIPAGSVVPSNSPFKLMSLQSGQYCKVVGVRGMQQLQCNADAASGSNFAYSAGGLFYQVDRQTCLAGLAHTQGGKRGLHA